MTCEADRSQTVADKPKAVKMLAQKPSYFFISPTGKFIFFWLGIMSITQTYNLIAISYRVSFDEICSENKWTWFFFDYSADFFYLIDIFVSFQIGFYDEDGVLQSNLKRTRIHNINSTSFYLDLLSLLPLDFLYISFGFITYVRIFRLVKVYKLWVFMDRLERHTNYANFIRGMKIIYYLLIFLHLNSCLYNRMLLSTFSKTVVLSLNGSENETVSLTMSGRNSYKCQQLVEETNRLEDRGSLVLYLNALVWAVQTMVLMNDQLASCEDLRLRVFFIVETIGAFLLFATVVGSVNNIVTNISADRKNFQHRLDRIKHYLIRRQVPERIHKKVIHWFDYLWMSNNTADETKITQCLPDKLKAEIAIHVHLNTLKRVEIFQNTEDGFLSDLVVRLKSQLYSPGDYICKKGEIGKQMYIVNKGRLQVLSDDEQTVVVTLKTGGYFGEISILNMGNHGNRRTASVRSVGFSDLYCLSKNDLWDVLKDYPSERTKLELVAYKRLKKIKESRQTNSKNSYAETTNEKNSPDSIRTESSTETFNLISKPHRKKSSCKGNSSQQDAHLHINSMSAIDENDDSSKSYQLLQRNSKMRESFSNTQDFYQRDGAKEPGNTPVQIASLLHPTFGHSCYDMLRMSQNSLVNRKPSYKFLSRPSEGALLHHRSSNISNQTDDSFPSLKISPQKSFENFDGLRRSSRNINEDSLFSNFTCIPEIRFQAATSNNGSRIFEFDNAQDKKSLKKEYLELNEKIHQLLQENERLKERLETLPSDNLSRTDVIVYPASPTPSEKSRIRSASLDVKYEKRKNF